MKPYEALFILAETVRDDNLDAFTDKLRGEIERAGGTIEQTLPMGRRSFAAPLKKREGGIYLRIDFQMAPGQVAGLRSRLLLNEDLFRFQIVEVGRERQRAARAAAEKAAAPAPAQEA